MTAITDANTFIDQNLINVPYQGVPATTLNACLKTITNVFNSYATIASVNSLFGYALDGNFPAALMSAPNQAFTLNGGYVSISALLLFSSGQKYTVGPDGNYILNAANGPAWDWSTGRRRLLIEGIGSTNYWTNSEALAAWAAGSGSATLTANGLFGVFSRINYTSGPSGTPIGIQGVSVTAGQVVSFTFALKAGTVPKNICGMLGGTSSWGVNADSTAVVLSGPGTIVQTNGGAFEATPSAAADTVYRITRTFHINEVAYGALYDFAGAPSAGKTFSCGIPQLEIGYGSSYIVAGASPTARAADVVTAASGLLALLTAANATLAVRGTLLSPDNAMIIGSTNRYGSVYLQNAGANFVIFDPAGGQAIYPYPSGGASKTFGVANSYSSAPVRKASVNGGAVASDAGVVEINGVDTGIGIGNGGLGAAGNLLLDELVVWPILASDVGLQAQARVYS